MRGAALIFTIVSQSQSNKSNACKNENIFFLKCYFCAVEIILFF